MKASLLANNRLLYIWKFFIYFFHNNTRESMARIGPKMYFSFSFRRRLLPNSKEKERNEPKHISSHIFIVEIVFFLALALALALPLLCVSLSLPLSPPCALPALPPVPVWLTSPPVREQSFQLIISKAPEIGKPLNSYHLFCGRVLALAPKLCLHDLWELNAYKTYSAFLFTVWRLFRVLNKSWNARSDKCVPNLCIPYSHLWLQSSQDSYYPNITFDSMLFSFGQ